jgi:phosphatidylglycerophosphatase A
MTGPPKRLGFWHPASLLATWFGAGLLPLAPGTWGSIAALPFAYLIVTLFGTAALLAATVVLFGAGWWAAGAYAEAAGEEDPPAVVVDEVVGQWLVLLAAPPAAGHYLAALILFRVFDILKPPPARQFERNLPGGLGIMLDDVAAGAYGFVVLYLLGLVIG